MPVVKEDYREEQRLKVLKGAFECFYKNGYELAKMDDIVTESGISKGTIYKLFKSKEEIYIQLIEHISNVFLEELKQIVSQYQTSKEKIAALYTDYLLHGKEGNMKKSFIVQSEFELYSSRQAGFNEYLDKLRKAKNQFIADLLTEGIQNGEFKKELDVTVYAEIFWSFVSGIMTQQLLYSNLFFEQIVNEEKKTFLKKICVET